MLIQLLCNHMVSITAVSVEKGKRTDYPVEKWFIASEAPLYIGIIVKPSPGLWEMMSRSRDTIMEIEGRSHNFHIRYRIEVGESSIFFATPAEDKGISEIL